MAVSGLIESSTVIRKTSKNDATGLLLLSLRSGGALGVCLDACLFIGLSCGRVNLFLLSSSLLGSRSVHFLLRHIGLLLDFYLLLGDFATHCDDLTGYMLWFFLDLLLYFTLLFSGRLRYH